MIKIIPVRTLFHLMRKFLLHHSKFPAFNTNLKILTRGIAVYFIFLQTCPFVIGQNPICPPGLNIADPTTRVWNDGKLYVYGSRDESLKYYCSFDNWVLSTSDLVHGEYIPNAFVSKGPGDQVPFNDQVLYAPDLAF